VLLAKDDINAAGGILGRPLDLIVEDNQSDLKTTATAFRKLADVDKVSAIIGPNWAEFTEVAAPISENYKIPMLSPSGYKEGLFAGKRFVFTLQPPLWVSAKPLADLLKDRGYKSITVLLNEGAYLEGIFEGMKKNMPPGALGNVMRLNPGEMDFRSLIVKMKQSDSDAVLALILENKGLSNFFRQAKQLQLPQPIFTANAISFDDIILKDLSIAEGVTYFDFVILGSPEFLQRYRERFKDEPAFASGRAYDSVFLLKEAIEKCGVERTQIRDCLAKTDYHGTSGEISFDREGVIRSKEKNTYLLQVRNGKSVRLEE